MSTVITKQAATGFPTDALTCYARDVATNTVYVYKITNLGVVTRKAIIPFPPASFSDTGYSSLSALSVMSGLSGGAMINAAFTTVTKFTACDSGVYIILGIHSGGTSEVYVPYGIASLAHTGITGIPTLMALASTSKWAFGLGKAVDDSPYPYINVLNANALASIGIDSSKCIITGNGLECFGSYINSTKCFVLLNNLLGYEVTIDLTTRVASYAQLTIPVGEHIIQYTDGYYITSDFSLYNINDGGTFVTNLTGTYAGTNAAKYMGIA